VGEQDTGAESQQRQRLPLRQRIEAVLIVVDEPVSAGELARVLDADAAEVAGVLASLRTDYLEEQRGFELRDVAGGWRLYSAAECSQDVERFILEGTQARLTHAALETLAVIAYRQPVSRQAIAAIRGVGVDGVVRTLLARGLIAEAGSGAAGAILYVTTQSFLSRLGISSLEELPSLAPYLPLDLDEFEDAF
jgi:segregation and condensation protein B